MKKTLALTNGILVAVMVLLNGLLASKVGNYLALIISYGVGLSVSFIILIVKKQLKDIFNNIPFYLFSASIVGVLCLFLNNVCMNNIGVALTLALGLTGQIVFSAIFEHFGLFGVIKKKLSIKKLPGYFLIIIGATLMIVMGV